MATRVLISKKAISERIERCAKYNTRYLCGVSRRYVRYELDAAVDQWCAENLMRHRLVTKRRRGYRAKHFIEVANDVDAVKLYLRWGSDI